MKKIGDFFNLINQHLLSFIIFIFPFFFLTITQEYFITNKFYLLGFSVLLLLLITIVQPLLTKKLSWTIKPLDLAIFLFTLTVLISIVISSPNKVQALTNLNFGGGVIIFLTILYFFVSRLYPTLKKTDQFQLISIILSLLTIIFFFNPLAKFPLPSYLKFLSSPLFNTFDNQLDLAIFLGFLLVFELSKLKENRPIYYKIITVSLPLLALFLTVFQIFKNNLLFFTPLKISWYAGLEILKNIKTAIFGVGPDNFSTIFTKVKDLAYNQSPLWQINSFSLGRISLLQIFIETGVLGFFAFGFLVVKSIKMLIKDWQKSGIKSYYISYIYLLICLFLFPLTFTILFLFFVNLGLLQNDEGKKIEIENENLSVIYSFSFIVFLLIIGLGAYLLGRSYLAELYFKKAVNGIVDNNIKTVYDNIKQARILNPYEEKYIINFSQTNILIANNLANKKKEEITQQDRQTISQAIQAAISEAKALITLNPQKAQYFENLANIYRNIIGIAQGADVWTISSYQRAIVLDPINPIYRLQLGGIYYLLSRYDDAVSLFQQAVSLKPDWPNAYYNLAWGYYQSKQYDKATNAMENVLKLIDKKTSSQDYEKANKELESFKNKLQEVEQEATASGELKLPKKSENMIDPKLKLPKEAGL